jgi:hypothetical protein
VPVGQVSTDPACSAAVSTVSVVDGAGAGGNVDLLVRLTNTSSSPCVTTGYPGVALLDVSGRQVDQAQRTLSGFMGGTRRGVRTLLVAPGQTATAKVEAHLYDERSNGFASSPALLVTLPDDTVSTRVSHTVPVDPDLQVHPFVADPSGDDMPLS